MPVSSASVPLDRVALERPAAEGVVVAAVALATMLAPLNSTMIAVALPHVMAEFGADVTGVGWLVTSYLIAMAALQPVAGKLGDRLGRRRLILGGIAWFGVVSIGAATSAGLPSLLFFRVQQAIAGAIALPNGIALLRAVVPEERRAARFGLVGAAAALAAAAGPPLGGILVGFAGWRAMFCVNVLLILPALALGWWGIPASLPRKSSHPFDLIGAMLLPVGLIGIAGLLTYGPKSDPALALTLGLAFTVLAATLLRRELSHPDPVLQPRLFGIRDFSAANAAIALSNLAMYSTLLAIPILLLRRTGWTSAEAGLVLAVMSLGMVIFSPVGGRLADRLGRRGPTVAGLSLLVLGLVPLALGGGAITTRALLAGLALIGVGIGLSSAGLQAAALEAVGAQDAGVASGLFSTSRYLGSIVGSGALGGFLGPARDGAAGFAGVFLMAGGAAFLSVLAVSTLGKSRG